ncbi:MAG TPA: tRNA lysidine(34) synthetase TilS [Bacillota bacterium]|nr:tRNA lysidine(34) synthetase TilS [Bacillota bacterium]
MLNKVEQTIKKYRMFSEGARLTVAVSGGADSLALLHILLHVRSTLKTPLQVVHVNHQLRGAEADADARLVEAIAAEWNLPCMIREVPVRSLAKDLGTSLENAARILRYQVLEEEAVRWDADRIVLGHHADDQAETVLLHLLRGAGIDGLAGILPVRDGRYIRPLLEVSRQEIVEYCQNHHIKYCTDSSNLDPVYLRNSVRLELLPFLRENYNTSVERSLCRLAELAREDSELLWELTERQYADIVETSRDKLLIDAGALATNPTSLQRRVLIKAWQQISGTVIRPPYERVEALRELVLQGHTGQTVQLPAGINAEKQYQKIILVKATGHNDEGKSFAYPLQIPGITQIPELGLTISAEVMERAPQRDETMTCTDRGILLLDADTYLENLEIRNRRPGDVFYPQGAPGKKKLKEYLIDSKIPRQEREAIPLLCSGNEVLWVIGRRKSESCRVTPETHRVLKLKVEKL